jgi:predicted nucleic acid-binding protein
VTGIVVSNTTPLIYLAKADDLHVLKKLFGNIHIPTEVYREAVESGLAIGYSDARRIDAACDDWIIVKPVSIDLGLMPIRNASRGIDEIWRGIHAGEIEAISLAIELGAETLIADDRAVTRFVRSTPSLFKFNVIGTGDVLDIALDRGIISKNEYEDFLHVFGNAVAYVK